MEVHNLIEEDMSPDEAKLYEEFKLALQAMHTEIYNETLNTALASFNQEQAKALDMLKGVSATAAESIRKSMEETKTDTRTLANSLKESQAAATNAFEAAAKKAAQEFAAEVKKQSHNITVKAGLITYSTVFILVLLLANLFITAYLVRLTK